MNVEHTKIQPELPKYAMRGEKGGMGSFFKYHTYRDLALVLRVTVEKFHQAQTIIGTYIYTETLHYINRIFYTLFIKHLYVRLKGIDIL